MAIPAVLFFFARKRRDLPFRPIFLLFSVFIASCGFTHFLGYYTFHAPIYRFEGVVKLVTAIASWATVLALIPITPKALAMRSPDELEREIAARKIAEAELRQARDELEQRVEERTAEIAALNLHLKQAMSETHHRVKNNLQIITALIEMHLYRPKSERSGEELQELGQHIHTLAAIHDLLTQEAKADAHLTHLSVQSMIEKLLPMLRILMDGRQIHADIRDTKLPIRQATSLVVILNELVSNGVKYGVGDIDVKFLVGAQQATLIVSNQGQGFPAGFDINHSANTGLELITSLVKWDLQGTVRFDNRETGGACVTILFPLATE